MKLPKPYNMLIHYRICTKLDQKAYTFLKNFYKPTLYLPIPSIQERVRLKLTRQIVWRYHFEITEELLKNTNCFFLDTKPYRNDIGKGRYLVIDIYEDHITDYII